MANGRFSFFGEVLIMATQYIYINAYYGYTNCYFIDYLCRGPVAAQGVRLGEPRGPAIPAPTLGPGSSTSCARWGWAAETWGRTLTSAR